MFVFYASLSNQSSGVWSHVTDADGVAHGGNGDTSKTTYKNKKTGAYEDGTISGAQFLGTTEFRPTSDVLTELFVTGMDPGSYDSGNVVYTDTDTYTFNFHRMATLSSFAVSAGDNELFSSSGRNFSPYTMTYTVENIPAGTTELTVSAPAYTSTGTVVKYDDGTGSYVEGTTASSFKVDLTKYTPDTDGKAVIPFMLDYTGSGNGVDGYYTLTVAFAEPPAVDYTPEITAVSNDAEISVGDELTISVIVTALESDTETSLSYQWYTADTADAEGSAIHDAKGSSFKVPTTEAGNRYYKCKVTRTVGSNAYTSTSGAVHVVVTGGENSAPNGFITNIIVKGSAVYGSDGITHDGILYKEFFDQSQTKYEFELTDAFLVEGYVPIFLLSTEKNGLYSSTSLESVDLNGENSFIRYSDAENRVYTNKDSTVSTRWILEHDDGITHSAKSLFYGLEPGCYLLKINVHEKDDAEHGDEYSLLLNFLPSLGTLNVSTSGGEITVSPATSRWNDAANLNDKFSTSTNTTALILQGTLLSEGTKVLLGNEDITTAFTSQGATVNLTQYVEDAEGIRTVPFSLVYVNSAGQEMRKNYTLLVQTQDKDNLRITRQPEGGVFDKGATVVLSVETNAEAGDVTWQWQASSSPGFPEPSDSMFSTYHILGATTDSLSAPTGYGGTLYYRCVVMREQTGEIVCSEPTAVTINVGKPNAPVIDIQPGTVSRMENGDRPTYKTEYTLGERIAPLPWAVGITEGRISTTPKKEPVRLELSWYYNTVPSTEGAKLLSVEERLTGTVYGGTVLDSIGHCESLVYSTYPITEELSIGDHYYFFVATAISNVDETQRTSITSSFAHITVKAREEIDGLIGTGTAKDPYLIQTVDDLKKVDALVMGGDFLSGAVFRFENNITLPAEWESIGGYNGGTPQNGSSLLPFSGIIDGNGKTLIYEKGARPLLEYARDAEVRNLFIYGEEINGSGLVERVCVDYGTDGQYQELTDPDVITVENVTLLSRSRTLTSGLVAGGFNSGINDVFIINCTIQENVVIGYDKSQSMIGSFVGRMNGRIENSVSYATVYGVDDVGGLAGCKSQSMGTCEFINSAFLGTVIATGGRVGGIIGSGYIHETGPNTPCVTVRNCYVVADITGNTTEQRNKNNYDVGSGIGGIIGSEIGSRVALNRCYITDNHFYGTITDTNPDATTRYTRVGGIYGELAAYSKTMTYQNNYSLQSSNYDGFGFLGSTKTDWNPEKDSFHTATAAEFADGTVTALLNEGDFKNWVQGKDGYPVHSDTAVPSSLTISGNYKTSYFVGDSFDSTGMIFTVGYSDGTKQIVDVSEITFSGDDFSKVGIITVTATYKSVSAETVQLTVLEENPDAITVSFVLYGDTLHGMDGETHTLAASNLTEWIVRGTYVVDENATVLDVFETALENAGLSWTNPSGNYITSITKDGVTLAEPATGTNNGSDSGWMYSYNGVITRNGISEQFLTDGDCILFFYTDDYTKESDVGGSAIQSMAITTEAPTVKAGEKSEALTIGFSPALLNGNVRCEWESSNTAIASVDRNGVVTGIAEGEATITAKAGGKEATIKVTVIPGDAPTVPVDSVTVSPAELKLKISETGTLTATVLPANATARDVQWSSGNEPVATVTNGVVTALKAGEAIITAEAGGVKATCKVTVEAPDEVSFTVALNAVLPFVKSTTPNPGVGSTYGEWAVFALNRGGVNDAEWNNKYLAELSAHLDKKNGVLTPYTEYARITLALTSMGYDATKFKTEKATYDLVSPLLDMQADGVHYMAEKQGNNGTAFALLALDSHSYLDTAEGRTVRAALIASLKASQLESGAWSISGNSADLDVTASAIYALAPYYLSEAKLTALGGGVTHDELKAMVDKALAWLSVQQATDGGFGSPEADGWVVVALSALDRDAATDTAFVKDGGSVLKDMLRYFDLTSGGFKHDITAKTPNQMASEQGAYDLVAYDRCKKGQKALYDMSDVTLKQNEIVSGGGSGSGNGGGSGGNNSDNSITVTMRLIGAEKATKDVDLGADSYLPSYVTWIPTTSYTLPEGALVYDLWTTATAAAGIESEGAERNYVKSVTAPSGYELAEFTNGPRSGWMYTLNGKHPNLGLKEQELSDGDVVVWHYVNDYSYEVEDWNESDPRWPALGDGTYWNGWLKAPDSTGGSGGGVAGGEKKDEKKDGASGGGTTSDSNTITADDGSTVTVETEKSVETKENEDGSVTEVVTETTKTTVVAPDGSTSVTETVVETETTTNSVKNADGSVTETTGTVEKVTETVTAADGTKQTTVIETAETKQLNTTTGADGKVSGAGTYSAKSTVTVDGKATTAVTEGTVAVSTDDKGTVSEVTTAKTVTTAPDGTKTETVTVITEAEMANGTTGKVVTDGAGNTLSAEATVSQAALEAAMKGDGVIEIPVTVNPGSGATVRISLEGAGEGGKVWVEIGTTETAPGNVAYLKLAEGVTKLLTTCKTGSVIVPVTGNCEVIVKDNSKSFSDVDAGAWYGDSVKFVTAREIFNGTGNGMFAPAATMNRAMAAQILYNLDGEAKAGDGTSFSDVKADDWFNGAVGWASGLGVITGYDGAYSPLNAVTRQDLVTILYRYAKQAGYNVSAGSVDLTRYADGAEVASYAAEAMRWAISVGLIKGYEDNTLRPTATATRAEVAAIMQRMVQTAVK